MISILGSSDEEWTRAVSADVHDVYHLPGYCRTDAEEQNSDAILVRSSTDRGELLVPLVLRDIHDAAMASLGKDVASPYGYASPLWRPRGADGDALASALTDVIGLLRSQGVVSAFVRLHPLLPLPLDVLERFGPVVARGQTVSMDLTLDDEQRWTRIRGNHQRQIRRSRALGTTTHIDAGWDALDAFFDAYVETMTRVGATQQYFFSRRYFEGLRDSLSGRAFLATARRGERVIAGAILTLEGNIVQYHLGATFDDALAEQPMKLIFIDAASWGSARGATIFHLGGGVGGADDSLLHFKKGFGTDVHQHHTWHVVVDAERYSALSKLSSDGSTFFPAYRARGDSVQ